MSNMKGHYELYGGPLDGDTVEVSRRLKQGSTLELDLVKCDYLKELRDTLSRPVGCAVFTLRGGKLCFDKMVAA